MKKFVLQFFVATAASLSSSASETVVVGNARFTLLTDRMVRCEWSEAGSFEDRPSLTFVNRDMPSVKYSSERLGEGVSIKTPKMELVWKGGAFTEDNLFVNGVSVLSEDKENLLGTQRTLDGKSGFADVMPTMEKGLLSRRGVTVVDDTKTPLFVDSPGRWGKWVDERPAVREGAYRDLTVFAYGHDYKTCLGDYVKVAGRIPLPPRWAFGYWWSRYWLYTDAEVRNLVDEIQSVGCPIDVFVIDMEWHETWNIGDRPDCYDEFGEMWGWTGYTWNRRLFPNPESTLGYLHDRKCKVALNLHPASGITPVEDCYGAFCRDYGWKGTNAVPYKGDEQRWAECYFDDVLDPLERQGVDFWWLDWQQWKMSKDKPTLSNTFWLNHIFAAHSAERSGGAERPFIYHRWGGLGSHRYQVGFSGDCKVSWGMLAAIPYFTATAANVGYGYWGHDIGGHHNPDGNDGTNGELFTRWLQGGVFTPIFKTHSTKDARIERRIWKYPEHFDALRDALRLRYRLAPYIYTAARQTYETGVSMCRPMYYDSPEDERAYCALNEYMFGDDILAVTVTNAMEKGERASKVDVFLPEGKWYDVSSGDILEGGCVLKRKYAIDQNPWLVRAGAVIPMYPSSVKNLAEPGTDDIELFFAPGADEGSCEVYEDGGTNPDYDANFRKTKVERRGGRIAIGPRAGAYTLRFPCMAVPIRVTVNGKETTWSWDAKDFAVVVKTPRMDGTTETVVEIALPDNAAEMERALAGFKGRQREIDAITEEFKSSLRPIHWALNLPDSWQDFWQTPAAIAAEPQRMAELLALREDARRRFADYLRRYKGKLDDGLWQRLAAYVPADSLEVDDTRETVVVEKTGEAVQRAIDEMHSSGGGRVVLRGGVYESGTIYLKSGVDLRIDKGAVLRGAATPDGYDDIDDPRIGKAPERSRKAFIVCMDGKNVAITGEGTIDGQGVSFYDTNVSPGARHFAKPALPRPRMVQFFKCDGVRIEGVTFKDSPGWTFWLRMCDDVTVNGIVVDGDLRMINNDGLHFDGCRRVRVRDSRLSTGDDCIVVRANRSPNGDSSLCEDVEVSRCVLRSACQAVRIGCPSDGKVSRVSFTDVDISGYNGVASVHPLRYLQRGSRGGCTIEGILFDRCRIDVEASPVVIDVQPGVVLGGIRNFVFRDSKMRGGNEMIVRGTAESPVNEVRFVNVEVANAPSAKSEFKWEWKSDSWEVEP